MQFTNLNMVTDKVAEQQSVPKYYYLIKHMHVAER